MKKLLVVSLLLVAMLVMACGTLPEPDCDVKWVEGCPGVDMKNP